MCRQIYILILLFCFFGCFKRLIGQSDGFFGHIWLDEGLSQSSVYSIAQDKLGLMWFGTQDGLNCYDGRQIDQFNFQPFNANSISSDNIRKICADTANAIWILTSGGLEYFDLNYHKAINISKKLNQTYKDCQINKIWMLDKKLYLSTNLGFCQLLKDGNGKISLKKIQLSGDKDLIINNAIFKNENLILATNKGLYSCSSKEMKGFYPIGINFYGNEIPKGLDVGKIQSLFAKENKLFFTIGNYFCCLDLNRKNCRAFLLSDSANSYITSAIIDNKNEFWLGTEANGLFRLTMKGDDFEIKNHFVSTNKSNYALKSNAITCLFQSTKPGDDVVWIGTGDAGVFNYCYSKNSFQNITNMLNENGQMFFGVTKDQNGIVWAGTQKRVFKIDRNNNQSSYFDLGEYSYQSQRPFEAIFCDNNNDLWFGNGNVLLRLDRKKNKLIPVKEALTNYKVNTVLRICALNENQLLLATWHGVVVYNKSTGETTNYNELIVKDKKETIGSVGAVYVSKKNKIWIGTTSGLYGVRNFNQKADFFSYNELNKNSLLSSAIYDINETNKGELLVATNKGLSILKDETKGSFENYFKVEGLTNNFIYGLLPDKEGNFWMSTNYGIVLFNPLKRSFRTYSAKDGIGINEFNSGGFYAAKDGELLFGGIGGVIGIYPDKLIKNNATPSVVLHSFKINQQNSDTLILSSKTPLQLKHNQNQLFFEFSIPEYSGNNNNRLFYKLNDLSNEWIEIEKTHSLSLANLAPGNYNLQVKAVNVEGKVSDNKFNLNFIIKEPFWATWWFYLMIFLFVFFITWLLYRARLQRNIEILKRMEEVRLEENEKVRKAAALDLHDEFGNGLTRISKLVEITKMKLSKDESELHRILEVISENSTRLYYGTKDFIWSIHPGNDNLYEIVVRIKDFGDELFYGSGISFDVNGLTESMKYIHQMPGTGRNIAMIFKEALHNSMKHAEAKKIKLYIETTNETIILRMNDDGKGFDEKVVKRGFGLSNMKQRASRIGAQLKTNSLPSVQGTEIILILKMN